MGVGQWKTPDMVYIIIIIHAGVVSRLLPMEVRSPWGVQRPHKSNDQWPQNTGVCGRVCMCCVYVCVRVCVCVCVYAYACVQEILTRESIIGLGLPDTVYHNVQ